MATITLHGTPINTIGALPAKGSQAPPFSLTASDLKTVESKEFSGKTIILNIFPSIDTSVCAASVRRFNQEAANLPDTVVLCISADLPFAHKRFCEAEGIDRVIPLSVFRSPDFGNNYGMRIVDGPIAGLLARSIVVIDKAGKVCYNELVGEVGSDPDFAAAINAARQCAG